MEREREREERETERDRVTGRQIDRKAERRIDRDSLGTTHTYNPRLKVIGVWAVNEISATPGLTPVAS